MSLGVAIAALAPETLPRPAAPEREPGWKRPSR